jgi:hypothetical protein
MNRGSSKCPNPATSAWESPTGVTNPGAADLRYITSVTAKYPRVPASHWFARIRNGLAVWTLPRILCTAAFMARKFFTPSGYGNKDLDLKMGSCRGHREGAGRFRTHSRTSRQKNPHETFTRSILAHRGRAADLAVDWDPGRAAEVAGRRVRGTVFLVAAVVELVLLAAEGAARVAPAVLAQACLVLQSMWYRWWSPFTGGEFRKICDARPSGKDRTSRREIEYSMRSRVKESERAFRGVLVSSRLRWFKPTARLLWREPLMLRGNWFSKATRNRSCSSAGSSALPGWEMVVCDVAFRVGDRYRY